MIDKKMPEHADHAMNAGVFEAAVGNPLLKAGSVRLLVQESLQKQNTCGK